MADDNNDKGQEYEQRVRRRLEILKKEIEAGKVQINSGLGVVESLKAVRYGPDGAIDLSTVDGLVRSLALAAEYMHDRNEAKEEFPLAEIQSTYFEFIERNFGEFFTEMKRRRLSPHDVGRALSESENSRKELASQILEFLTLIKDFWNVAGAPAHFHLEDMNESLKAVFGGDLFPSHNESIASKCGVYADTIILPDPYIRSEWAFGRQSDERNVYYFLKHAMNLLQYKSLADAKLDIPIIAIAPDFVNPSDKKYVAELGEEDALVHAEKLFNRHFGSIDEFLEFSQS
jgi:hypothetical protein